MSLADTRYWRTLDSKYLIEDRWLRVRADTCVTPRDANIHPYYVVDYPPGVTIFAVSENDELVLVRQYRHARPGLYLELPGGGFDQNESDPIAVARRELLEETGYAADQFEEIGRLVPDAALLTTIVHVVIATGLRRVCEPSLDHGEELEVVLMPLRHLRDELQRGTFTQAVHVAALWMALANRE